MALIKWDNNFRVNVPLIDYQHKHLIAMINELNDALQIGKGNDVSGKIVRNLVTYTKTHFKTEEDLFAKFRYPDSARHKMEHDAFIKKVEVFSDELEKGKLSLSMDIISFLSDWLSHHILGTDRKYIQFFKENNENQA